MRQFLLLANLANEIARQADLLVYLAALSDCKLHKLPLSIVNLGLLRHQLLLLESKLKQRNLDFVFPIENLSPYYHHSLSTCNINNQNNTISITLRVPIKRKVDSFRLESGVSIPFMIDDQVCQYNIKYFQVLYKNNIPTVVDNDNEIMSALQIMICVFIANI